MAKSKLSMATANRVSRYTKSGTKLTKVGKSNAVRGGVRAAVKGGRGGNPRGH